MENKFVKNLDNMSATEKGAFGYKSTFDPMVDFNYKIASYRGKSEEEIKEEFDVILEKGEEDILKFLFYIRDIREGLGERRLFRICLKELVSHDFKNKKKIIRNLCDYIMEYGRADDLFCLLEDGVEKGVKDVVYEYIVDLYSKDIIHCTKKEPVSLLAKWMPSENASSKNTKILAKILREKLNMSPKTYRKSLSALRDWLNVVERQMSANQWEDIDYNRVPSKANLNYRNAFFKHDPERREKYFEDLKNNVEGVKMNSSVNFPYEIVSRYSNIAASDEWSYDYEDLKVDESLEFAWKNLKEIPAFENCLVVADDSGSMMTNIPGAGRATAMDVARSIAVYGAQHLKDAYHNKIMTFSEAPQFLDISGKKTLKDILGYLEGHSEVANTNIEAVFDLVLSTAVENNLKQEDLPQSIIIISDMEFDECAVSNNGYITRGGNPIKSAQKKFAKVGYSLPTLIFWNVNSRTCTIPVKENRLGVLLISGFSQNLFKMVSSGDLDTRKMLDNILNSDRYSKIEKIYLKGIDK